MSTGLFFPALRGPYNALSNLSYPLVRVVAGLFLVPHGARKLFGWFGGSTEGTAEFFTTIGLEPALLLTYASGTIEFFGGLLIAVGLWTRPVAAAVIILMIVAIERVHLGNGFFIFNNGYEYALMWLLVTLAILFRGGGPLSVDAAIGKEF